MNIVKSDDIWTFQPLVDLYFRIECSFGVLVFIDLSFVDHFDSHFFFAFLINALKNLSESTWT